jgi:predicted glycosyltransferase
MGKGAWGRERAEWRDGLTRWWMVKVKKWFDWVWLFGTPALEISTRSSKGLTGFDWV